MIQNILTILIISLLFLLGINRSIIMTNNDDVSKLSSMMNISHSQKTSLYDSVYAKVSGHVYMAAMVSIHHPTTLSNGHIGKLDCTEFGLDGIVEQDGLQVLGAIQFGLELLSSRNITGPIKLGLVAIDTCQNSEYALQQSRGFLQFRITDISKTYYCPNNSITKPIPRPEFTSFDKIFSVLGGGNSDVTLMAASYLKLLQLPLLSYFSTSHDLSDRAKFPYFYRTVPDDMYAMQALLVLIKRYGWNQILILRDSTNYCKQLLEMLTKYLNYHSNLCIAKTQVIIPTEPSKEDLNITKNEIIELTAPNKKWGRIRLVLTLLAQPIAQSFIEFIEDNPDPRLADLIWLGTDAWIGRHWSRISANNNVLQNCIGILPSSRNVPGFWEYYTSQLPSKTDSNPWLARKFELICNCQYQNNSLFILPELNKIRKQNNSSISCESIESSKSCHSQVYKDSHLMLYIHYVIDSVLVYGHIIKQLMPSSCHTWNEICETELWTALNTKSISKVMPNISFIDSTGESFTFWKGYEGFPEYTVFLSQPHDIKSPWKPMGTISKNVSNHRMYFNITNSSLDNQIRDPTNKNFQTESCSKPCPRGYASTPAVDSTAPSSCCRFCLKCQPNSVVINRTQTSGDLPVQDCHLCKEDEEPNLNYLSDASFDYKNNTNVKNNTQNLCKLKPLVISGYGNVAALSILVTNLVGIIGAIIVLVILLINWKTPLVVALNPHISIIILAGTFLSFAFSIALLDHPNKANCILRWIAPGFCSALCYAAILTKTNRIARIFAMKPNSLSRRGGVPLFISSFSQVNIVLIFVAIECIILIVLTTTNKPQAIIIFDNNQRRLDCTIIDTSTLLATFFLPILLLLAATVYAFKIRKVPDGFNETRNINFLNFANCIIFFCCLILYKLLKHTGENVLPLCLLLTLGAIGNILGIFAPRIYVILFRPFKNTSQAVWSKTRSESSISVTSFHHQSSINTVNQIRCRDCQKLIEDTKLNAELNNINKKVVNSKVQFSLDHTSKEPQSSINEAFEDI